MILCLYCKTHTLAHRHTHTHMYTYNFVFILRDTYTSILQASYFYRPTLTHAYVCHGDTMELTHTPWHTYACASIGHVRV